MTKDLSAFFAANVEEPEVVEVTISKRFKNKDGNPELFEFKAISNDTDNAIRKMCIRKKLITQGPKKGQHEQEFDALKYQTLLTIESMVHPNLRDVELQKQHGVMGEEDLFNKLFLPAEIADAYRAAEKANGYEKDMSELVEDVKN